MAACTGSLQHIFEKPLPEKPNLLESLSSWKNQINPIVEQAPSFTEIFGELHFKEINNHNKGDDDDDVTSNINSIIINTNIAQPPPLRPSSFDFCCPSSSSPARGRGDDDTLGDKKVVVAEEKEEDKDRQFLKKKRVGGRSLSYTPMNYESLQLCTEGLGFESSDDVDVDMKSSAMHALVTNRGAEGREEEEEKHVAVKRRSVSWDTYNGYTGGWLLRGVGDLRRMPRGNGAGSERGFPPPISCIGKSGKPWVSFKSYREEGRFVLKEVRIPTQEFLHASREDGRLKLKFIQPEDDEEYLEEEEEEEEEDENCLEENEILEEDEVGELS